MTKRKTRSPEFKARVEHYAISKELTLADVFEKYGVHSRQISTWKRAALDNLTSEFRRRGSDPWACGEQG